MNVGCVGAVAEVGTEQRIDPRRQHREAAQAGIEDADHDGKVGAGEAATGASGTPIMERVKHSWSAV